MSIPKKISGFLEWLPEEKIAEDKIINIIKKHYKLHGFTHIETSAVELIDTITKHGSQSDTAKEIYAINRLGDKSNIKAKMALHFDLTIPFSRYVAQNYNKLTFPFKRYQIQKVWRGERAQMGRFREFYQSDIDVVNSEYIPLCFDGQLIEIANNIFEDIGIKSFIIKINNKKILKGIYNYLNMPQKIMNQVFIVIDKINKIGKSEVENILINKLKLNNKDVSRFIRLINISATKDNINSLFSILPKNSLVEEGLAELSEILSFLDYIEDKKIVIDLSIVRGLGYYTGSIYEVILQDCLDIGSICAGGRYDNLISNFTNKKFPGVGISIGLTRLLYAIFQKKIIKLDKDCNSILISNYRKNDYIKSLRIARKFRAKGIECDIFYEPSRMKKQINFAAKKGMGYVIFLNNNIWSIKNINSGVSREFNELEIGKHLLI